MNLKILFLLFFIPNSLLCQIRLKGSVDLDSTWTRSIYASSISSFHDMYKCSDQLIIAQTEIDSAGLWELEIPIQPFSHIIRLHISKKGDPTASLIIGGQDENHGFFAIDHEDQILPETKNCKGLFSSFSSSDHFLNNQMLEVQSISEKWERLYESTRNEEEKESVRRAAARELLEYADSSHTILSSIYAAHLSDMGFNRSEVYRSISDTKERLGDHPYLAVYPIAHKGVRSELLLLLIIGIVLAFWLGYKAVRSYTDYKRKLLLKSLSLRERNVLHLVKSGKSNKEIALTLNIEVSTVKSHVNSIFSKLKITSRSSLQDI